MKPEFSLKVGYNEWIAVGDTAFDAAVTVDCDARGSSTAEVAEIVLIDRSASMNGRKFREAQKAATAAVDALRDGAHFAIVAGASEAVPQYPLDGTLREANERTRAEAREAIEGMSGGSTTETGVWLRCAADILATRPGVIGHVLLLTDGQVTQPPHSYRADLDYCRGKFTCDSVGIGLDWNPDQLEDLAERFRGSFKFCEDLAELPAFFTEVCGRTMSKAVDEVELRVFVPVDTGLNSAQQMHPILDLVPHLRRIGTRGWAFPLAAWGSEEREYLLRIELPPMELGTPLQLRVEVWQGNRMEQQQKLKVTSTEEPSLFLADDPGVSVLLGQTEISEQIGEALRAWAVKDYDTATRAVAQAHQKAKEKGLKGMMRHLSRLTERDPKTGQIRLRSDLDRADELSARSNRLETESSRVVLGRKEER